MKYLFVLFFVIALAGCGSVQPPLIVNHEVLVTVPCKIAAPEKPVMPFTDTAKRTDSIFVKTKKVLAEIEIRKGYENLLEAGIRSCQ